MTNKTQTELENALIAQKFKFKKLIGVAVVLFL